MSNKQKIGITDFIHGKIKIADMPKIDEKKAIKSSKAKTTSDKTSQSKYSSNIDPKARLSDFANIKMVNIDPRISRRVEKLSSQIKRNLEELRNLW